MDKRKIVLLSATSLMSISVLSFALFLRAPHLNIEKTSATETTKTFTNEQLKSVALEDHSFKNKAGDKKFSIDLGQGKYIEGGIMFHDCDHQVVGDTLGDDLTLDNSLQANANVSNFNILFNIHGVYSIDVSWSFSFDTTNTMNYELRSSIKFSNEGANGLYDAIENSTYTYQQLVDGNIGSAQLFWADGGSNPSGGKYKSYTTSTTSDTLDHSLTFDPSQKHFNIVAFQPETTCTVGAGVKYSVSLRSISFTYTC